MTFEGIYVRMVYDDSATGGGRLSEKQFFDNAVAYNNGSGTPTERLLVTYDAFGRIVQQQHIRPTVTDTYTTVYDSQGRVTQETTPTGTIQYQYDLLGRKTHSRTVVSTVPTDILTEITYTYDLFGRLSTVNTVRRDGAIVDSNGAAAGTPPESTTYFYDLLGRPDYTIMPNGVIEDYTFDAMDRLDLMAHRKSSDNSVLASYDYTYRADGKRTGLTESFSTTTTRTASYTWSYDAAGRLTSEVLDSSDNSIDQTESYTYDLFGNRVKKEVNKPATAYVDHVFAYNYDANDRITSETLDNGINGTGVDQTTTYGWTQTQQTSKSVQIPSTSTVTQAMSYGLGGQLERVITTTQNGSGTVTARTQVEYRYDTQGIRFIAIDSTDSNLGTPGIERIENGRTEYLIDRANFTGYQQTILETVKNAAGQATKRTTYTYGADEITQTVSNLNASTGAVVSTETHTFAHDGKGSVRALFGAAATIAQVFTYSAYGELLAIHNGAGTLQPLASSLTSVLYNGEGFDSRTGLYNMRARWYSPTNARWERLDPFAGNPTDPFSFHKYGFVHGNPVMGVDPTGREFSISGMTTAIGIGLGKIAGLTSILGSVFTAVNTVLTVFDVIQSLHDIASNGPLSQSIKNEVMEYFTRLQTNAADPEVGVLFDSEFWKASGESFARNIDDLGKHMIASKTVMTDLLTSLRKIRDMKYPRIVIQLPVPPALPVPKALVALPIKVRLGAIQVGVTLQFGASKKHKGRVLGIAVQTADNESAITQIFRQDYHEWHVQSGSSEDVRWQDNAGKFKFHYHVPR